ncbi:hypothetical protein LEN26_004206 [Aphanomyces euteiches]|nr:hypothetical protein LEN26_004206 [Aphanomyces euteiches]
MKSTHQRKKFQFHLNNQWGKDNYFLAVNDERSTVNTSSTTNRWGGVATILRKGVPGFDRLVHLSNHDVPNRYLLLHTKWGQYDLFYHNVYAPVEGAERAEFFEELPSDFPHDAIHIVMGDLNVPFNPQLDSKNPQAPWSGRLACLTWLSSIGVVDIWRTLQPLGRVFSSPGLTNRLDYICASEFLRSNHDVSVRYVNPIRDVMGDHLAVSMVVEVTSIARRSPFWIMPSSLLEVQDIVDTIKDEAKALLPLLSSANNPGVVWSGWKKRVKAFLKAYNGLNRRTKWDPVADAKAYITKTQRDVRQGWASQSAMEHAVESYNLLRTEAKTTKTEEAFKIHRFKHDQGSRYFFRRPYEELRAQTIYKALDRDGTLQTSKEGIDLAFHQHWSEIMRSDGRDTPLLADSAAYALKLQSKLSTEAKESLDFPITIHELAESIRAMAPEKSPGMDGFTAKFYQLDPLLFGKILHIVFNYQLQRGELLKFQRQSATALLYKSGATCNTGNYRPIALMPVTLQGKGKALSKS